MTWEDQDDEWTAVIDAAHPARGGSHEHYATAMKMVGNRHAKGALVSLVCWLLGRVVPDVQRTGAVDAKGNVVPGAWTVRPARMLRYEQAERVCEAVREYLPKGAQDDELPFGTVDLRDALARYDALKAAE